MLPKFEYSYQELLPEEFFAKAKVKKFSQLELIFCNHALKDQLNLPAEVDLINLLQWAASDQSKGTIAQAYAGHQFGHFTNLGDGRAVLIGEVLDEQGIRRDMHVKGAGRTRYSRGGDGLAALGPMIREYLMSEAMHALGVPTTRSLAVFKTGDKVFRENELDGAMLLRVANSHIRVGTFEYAAALGKVDKLKALADYAIQRHYVGLKELPSGPDKYLSFFKAVVENQSQLIAHWMSLGFVHGVMNTDNMSICGETIDYGPCAFIDSYDKSATFSSIDRTGRYAYGNQPRVAMWNLARLAEALMPLFNSDGNDRLNEVTKAVYDFEQIYEEHYYHLMCKRLGLKVLNDRQCVDSFLNYLVDHHVDYHLAFAQLHLLQNEPGLFTAGPVNAELLAWRANWVKKTSTDELMANNPRIVPRNFWLQEAIDSVVENGDYTKANLLMKALLSPYAELAECSELYKQPPMFGTPYRTLCGT